MKSPTAVIMFLLCVLILGLAPPIISGPQLYKDTLASHRWSTAPSFQITDARCTRYMFLVSTCSIKFIDPGEYNRPRSLDYFVAGSWGSARFSLIRATDNPSHFSISIAEEHLLNRQLTLLVWSVVMTSVFGFFVVGAIRFFRARRVNEDYLDAIPLQHGSHSAMNVDRSREPNFK